MNCGKLILTGALALACAAPGAAQMKQDVARCFTMKPKAGMVQLFEAGRKRHMSWHKQNNDKWAWADWEIMTGSETGSHMVCTSGRDWKDYDGMDDFDAKDGEDVAMNAGAYIESTTSAFWVFSPDLSMSTPSSTPPKYLAVTEYQIKPESINTFTAAIKQINEGLKKSSGPATVASWYFLASGGEGPRFALVIERNSFAEFGSAKTVTQLLEESLGKDAAAKVLNDLRTSYRYNVSYVMQYRPEMSYTPAK